MVVVRFGFNDAPAYEKKMALLPRIGERIEFPEKTYAVHGVTHTPYHKNLDAVVYLNRM